MPSTEYSDNIPRCVMPRAVENSIPNAKTRLRFTVTYHPTMAENCHYSTHTQLLKHGRHLRNGRATTDRVRPSVLGDTDDRLDAVPAVDQYYCSSSSTVHTENVLRVVANNDKSRKYPVMCGWTGCQATMQETSTSRSGTHESSTRLHHNSLICRHECTARQIRVKPCSAATQKCTHTRA